MEITKKKPNRNSGTKKYNYWNGKFTKWLQKLIWVDRKISKLRDIQSEEEEKKEWRKMNRV
jgi:hypothetical protein